MVPLVNPLWRHLCVRVLPFPRQLTMILLRNRRRRNICVQVSHLPRKGLSRDINGTTLKLGNLSTRRLRHLPIKPLGIFNLHPNVVFLLLPETAPFLAPLVAPLSTVPFSKANIWMPWGRPYLRPHPLSLNLLTNAHIPSDFCHCKKKQVQQRRVYF
jgi:hypothetical protein